MARLSRGRWWGMTNVSGEHTPLVSKESADIDNEGESKDESAKHTKDGTNTKKGLGTVSAGLFIIGEVAGTGLLALPSAIDDTGWIGFVLMFVCCIVSGYCGVILAKCWIILQERNPKYRNHVRHPYQTIGLEAAGRLGRIAVTACMDFTLFGGGVVFLILASQNVMSLLHNLAGLSISFCYWCIIIAIILTPISWLGSPKDLWPIALIAMVSTSLASILLLVQILMDMPSDISTVTHRAPSFQSFFLAFGTMLFAFGGLAIFPSIQNDMREPKRFGVSVLGGFGIVFIMYVPVAAAGYVVYGSAIKSNVTQSLSVGALRYSVEILITVHLVMAFVIVINPLCQELEELMKIPLKFNWRRCVIRTCTVALILFVAETVPHFGKILALVGGSANTMLTFVFPSVFYMRLCKAQGNKPEWEISLVERVFNYEVICVGLVGGAAATYAAVSDIVSPGSFLPPCYINITAASGS